MVSPAREAWIAQSDMIETAILQVVATAPRRRLRQAIEAYLRDKFADERRQAMADRELPDA
jgi:hypothetical protein